MLCLTPYKLGWERGAYSREVRAKGVQILQMGTPIAKLILCCVDNQTCAC